jgi:transcriptional regulator with XRE-family HTH domain
MEIAALVADARTRAGLSQRELARRASTSQSAIARIEAGVVSPSFETARRLISACGFELRLSLEPSQASDPVVQAYKRDVDRTLLRENLRKTVDQRLGDMEAFRKSANQLRRAVAEGGGRRRSRPAPRRSKRRSS